MHGKTTFSQANQWLRGDSSKLADDSIVDVPDSHRYWQQMRKNGGKFSALQRGYRTRTLRSFSHVFASIRKLPNFLRLSGQDTEAVTYLS